MTLESGLKIVGAGFGRTGTLSLKRALERLDLGKCYHMVELSDPQIAFWQAASDQNAGSDFPWQDVFEGYSSAVDWPASAFWRPLLDRFPNAKCILSLRDPAAWYVSTRDTLHKYSQRMLELDIPEQRERWRMVRSIIWDGIFQGRFEDRDFAIDTYLKHIDEVGRQVSPERLLKFEVREGWEPLCAFLGAQVPDEPFPHANSSEEINRLMGGV